jgi:NADH-quinone oxidoreductase subunit G
MPKIVIDGEQHECGDGITVLQAALEAGFDVPHYCYHPGLSVVASCRLCLMEMKAPHPKTGELGWAPKLFPSCQTYIKDGLEVRFASDNVQNNQRHVMEFLLLNHPLDCPVCDQAGECHLQDYSHRFGNAESRMTDAKIVNPKKDIGPHVLLYQDRCVMCTRCVRFNEEISGTGELAVVSRGSRCEIDVFPGTPLDNPLSGNVVDICPVGALLDKKFLYKQRVWFLKSTASVCAGCSQGCNITIDHNKGRIHRLRPRFNPNVNDWWICDAGRHGWEYVQDERRLTAPSVRRGSAEEPLEWQDVSEVISIRIESALKKSDSAKTLVVMSPFLTCEEAWLLAESVRRIDPKAVLALGPVPTEGEDRVFPSGFTIRAEKCPNRRGVELVLSHFGGPQCPTDEIESRIADSEFRVVWLTGGYPEPWWSPELTKAVKDEKNGPELVILQDIFESPIEESADIVLASAAWAEKEGAFVNSAGIAQPIEWAVEPPEGARRDGQILWELSGRVGLFNPQAVQEEIAAATGEFELALAPPSPKHQH